MAAYTSFSLDDFKKMFVALGVDWGGVPVVAVAVSGGPDSMALCKMLSEWACERRVEVHALTVDHGLRTGSAEEAVQVAAWLAGWPQIRHAVLEWQEPVQSAIQEEARRARYSLMAEYCREHEIRHLFLAHHADDQAETVLFRLAKGSGLDGLAGMQAAQVYDEGLMLVRPLLECTKDDLACFCEEKRISYIEDPSNEDGSFARARLRRSREILEVEGLSSKRINVTAKRLLRARKALDGMAGKIYKDALLKSNTGRVVFNFDVLIGQPEEIVLRCVLKGLAQLRPEADYAPRMEKVEALVDDLISSDEFRKRTLGGVVFERDDKAGELVLVKEQAEG